MSPRGRLAIALASTLLVGYVALGSLLGRVLGDTTYGQLALFNEVLRIVLDAYVEPVNVDRAMNGARAGPDRRPRRGQRVPRRRGVPRLPGGAGRENDAEIGVILSRRVSFLMVVTHARRVARGQGGHPARRPREDHRRPAQPPALRGRGPAPAARRARLGGEAGAAPRGTPIPSDVDVVRERLTPIPATGRMLDGGAAYVKVAEFTPKVDGRGPGRRRGLQARGRAASSSSTCAAPATASCRRA